MRLIKLGFISLVVLGILISVISLLMPSTIFVSRSININAPKDSVYAHIIDLKLWKEWCANMDGGTIVYSGISAGLHASVKVDKTTITIDSLNTENISVMINVDVDTVLAIERYGFRNRSREIREVRAWGGTRHIYVTGVCCLVVSAMFNRRSSELRNEHVSTFSG